jgi:raffinose/stachyose/melibiose transport system substrate-binding protein
MRIHRLLTAVALAALAAGCGTPGGDSGDNAEDARESNANAAKIDVSKAGNVTLTVWDQEVRGGQARQIKRLNEQFQSEYPNVKIERVAKSFTDLNTTLKLAVSGPKAPDVVQANQGRQVMGQLVKGGLLKPMDAYAEAYGWGERWAKTLLDLNSFSPDGETFGSGNLFGVSQMGEIVGVFYNKDKVPEPPKTFAEFEQMLAQAKQGGDVPISFGNLDKFGGIHEFQTVQNQFVDKQAVRDFVFGRETASFATAENEEAAAKLQDWAEDGYFTPDFNGTGYDAAWQQFAKGRGPFLIGGTWLTADLASAMGDKVGFFLLPGPEEGAPPVSLGGESLPWGITSKSKNADVAAAYIDHLTDAEAAAALVETDNLPAMATDVEPEGALSQDVFAAWQALNEADGFTPYIDYATPTFYDDFSAAVQRLMAGRLEARDFVAEVQGDYTK